MSAYATKWKGGVEMEIFQLEQLSFQYPTGKGQALENINLQIHTGEFILLCGTSGCGKTTLLRQLKPAIAPHGQRMGRILFRQNPLSELDPKEQAGRIGFVSQNPEDQIVTDKVWHELAFGLESLGIEQGVIRKRVAEMSHFFGIQEWFHKDTAGLSGGQKQLLNLASVMVMQPEILLLDEPTSQLDPIAAADFLGMLGRIHRELGTTILMTEHRLEEALTYGTRMLVMEKGRLILDGAPREVIEKMRRQDMGLLAAMPASVQVWHEVECNEVDLDKADWNDSLCPLTVQEGREWFDCYREKRTLFPLPKEDRSAWEKRSAGKPAVELKEVYFRYERKEADVLKDLSFSAYPGELLAILGGNGSGKTTALSVISGGLKPKRGKVTFPLGQKRIIGMPQNPQLLFVEDTAQRELEEMLNSRKADVQNTKEKQGALKQSQEEKYAAPKQGKEEKQAALKRIIELCRLEEVLEQHPYDLSGGEQQRLALGKVLLAQPEILLLDEPTKGLDAEYKKQVADILHELTKQGITVIMVSHDVEFCAQYADRCMLFFDGQVAAMDLPKRFFSENHFYTTNANRMVRHCLPLAVTVEDVILACCGKQDGKPKKEHKVDSFQSTGQDQDSNTFLGGARQETIPRLEEIESQEGTTRQKAIVRQEDTAKQEVFQTHASDLPMRTKLGILISLLAIPVTILAGVYFLQNERYLFIALLVLLECMLPFFLTFEGKKPSVRELIILSVLCAIGVAGRAVFSMLPNFKPVTAVAIIAGVAFGGEAGFLVGALSILISNMLFGQGPWTPWQMLAMGLVGLFAGLLFSKREKGDILFLLCIYGFVAAVLLYGGIMNSSTAITAGVPLSWSAIGVYYLSGLPMDLIHGISTILFLLLGAKPMLKKLERVKRKFG